MDGNPLSYVVAITTLPPHIALPIGAGSRPCCKCMLALPGKSSIFSS
jgi:hypothetical protein